MDPPGVPAQSRCPNFSDESESSTLLSSLQIHKEKCKYLITEAAECERIYCKYNSRLASVGEKLLHAARVNAKLLLDECSEGPWLLKAVELWDCKEHFLEIIFDLWWSVYIMILGVPKVESVIDRDNIERKVLEFDSEQNAFRNALTKINKEDEDNLSSRVKAESPEGDLARILRRRFEKKPDGYLQNQWSSALKTFSFPINKPSLFRRNFTSESKSGANGVIMKYKWFYEKEFAMKMRHPEEDGQKTFEREFNILNKYRGPYIVEVVDHWVGKESFKRPTLKSMCFPLTPKLFPILLMESLEFDLKDLMERCKPLVKETEGFSGLDTIRLMLPIARALRFLHGKDVAHRDLKPEDIMCKNVKLPTKLKGSEDDLLNEDIVVKLIDFGEARENVHDIPNDEWGPAGTPGYMDPAMWKRDVSKYRLFMGDVFSFAMVFAELLTWRSPLETLNVQSPSDAQGKQEVKRTLRPYEAQRKLIADKRPQLPKKLPEYLKFIVESCWHVDPWKRPDFNAICSMLQYAKVLLLDKDAFTCMDDFTYKEAFKYEDLMGGGCRISEQT